MLTPPADPHHPSEPAPPLPVDGAVLAAVQQLADCGQRIAVPLAGGQVTWRRWGQGPAVVLLHGGSGSWTHWVRNIQALAEQHTVLAPDIPGYGDSDEPPPGTPVEALAERLSASLPAVCTEPVALVGFSFGGILSGLWAAAHPRQVRQLVLVGAVGLGILRRGQRPMRPWRYETDAAELQAIHRHNLAALMLHTPEAIDDLAIALQDANVRRTRYLSKHAAPGDTLAMALAQVRMPLAGIWGAHDVTASGRLDEVQALLQLADANAPFEVIAGAGHWVPYEAADRFNTALARVLARVR